MQKEYITFKHLGDAIVDFVITWDAVLDEKLSENGKKRDIEAEKNNVEISNDEIDEPVSPAYDFINEWLTVDENGKLAPHFSKRYPKGKRPRKRTNIYPTAADIIDYLCEYMPGNYTDESAVENSVNRALPLMASKGRIEKNDEDKTYRPVTIEYKRKTMVSKLVTLGTIDERQFFSVSASTYIIFYTTNYLTKEIEFFKEYVGTEALVDVFAYDNKVIILVKGRKVETSKIGVAIRSAVEKAYIAQEENRKKASKNYRVQSK